MTASAIIEIVSWGADAIKAIVDVIRDATQGAEPPSLDELRKKIHDAIDARSADWIKDARAEADKALVESAEHEFSGELKKIADPQKP